MNVEHVEDNNLVNLDTDNELVNFLISYITLNRMSRNECLFDGKMSVNRKYSISVTGEKSEEECELAIFTARYNICNIFLTIKCVRNDYNQELIDLSVEHCYDSSLVTNKILESLLKENLSDIFIDDDFRSSNSLFWEYKDQYEVVYDEVKTLEKMKRVLSLLEEYSEMYGGN